MPLTIQEEDPILQRSLGNKISVTTDYIAIKFYDSGEEARDGDIVSAKINGKESEPDVNNRTSNRIDLSDTDKVYNFRLNEGSNKLLISLISEGRVRPSTVGFEIKPLLVNANYVNKAITGEKSQSFDLSIGSIEPLIPPITSREFEILVKYPEIVIDGNLYPESARHIVQGQRRFSSKNPLTLERKHTQKRRDDSTDILLKDWRYSIKPIDYNKVCERDEWPPATFLENGGTADVVYVTASDNRGAGSQIPKVTKNYLDGAKFKMKAINAKPSTKYCSVPPQS